MPTPEFVLATRKLIGHELMWMPAVTAVVLREDSVLLVRRADNGAWTPVSGILDPGEQPAVGAVREVREETGVAAQVERLASVTAGEPMEFANGDRAQFLDVTFRCRYVSGDAHVADDESVDVGWFPLNDLPSLPPRYHQRLAAALTPDGPSHFLT